MKQQSTFEALELALELCRNIRLVLGSVGRKDPKLADQIRRATQSVALNLSEGRGRIGKDRVQIWRIAFGSAEEVETALRVAEAMGLLGPADVESVLAILERLHAMLWRLTH